MLIMTTAVGKTTEDMPEAGVEEEAVVSVDVEEEGIMVLRLIYSKMADIIRSLLLEAAVVVVGGGLVEGGVASDQTDQSKQLPKGVRCLLEVRSNGGCLLYLYVYHILGFFSPSTVGCRCVTVSETLVT